MRASVARFARVAACSSIASFIAGATTSGMRAASAAFVSRSSAMPSASFAIMFAVAGTIASTSASRASGCAGSLRAFPQRGPHRPPRKRGERRRADEALRLVGEHDVELRAALHQPARQRGRFIGRDPAGDPSRIRRSPFTERRHRDRFVVDQPRRAEP